MKYLYNAKYNVTPEELKRIDAELEIIKNTYKEFQSIGSVMKRADSLYKKVEKLIPEFTHSGGSFESTYNHILDTLELWIQVYKKEQKAAIAAEKKRAL